MNKVELEIYDLSESYSQSRAWVMSLKEKRGNRALPIIIGWCEAQAIMLQLQNFKSSRPLTHDLLLNVINNFDAHLQEVLISKIDRGVFYANLICVDNEGKTISIDARTSDALAVALKSKVPIFTVEEVMKLASREIEKEMEESQLEQIIEEEKTEQKSDIAEQSMDELNAMLNEAIENEDFEMASLIRDEIKKRSE